MPSAKQTAVSASSTRTGVHHGCRPARGPDRPADALAEGSDDRVVSVGGRGRPQGGDSRHQRIRFHQTASRAARVAAGGGGRARLADAVALGVGVGQPRGPQVGVGVGVSVGGGGGGGRQACVVGVWVGWVGVGTVVGVLVGRPVSLGVWVGVGFLVGCGGSVGWWPSSGASPSTFAGGGNSSTSMPSMSRFIIAVQVSAG